MPVEYDATSSSHTRGAVGDLILTLPALKLTGRFRKLSWNSSAIRPGPSWPSIPAMPTVSSILRKAMCIDFLVQSPSVRSPGILSAQFHPDRLVSPDSEETIASNLQRYCAGQILSWCHIRRRIHTLPNISCNPSCLGCISRILPLPQVYLTPDAQATAERFWRREGLPENGVIAWHPGSGGAYKLWPLAGWQQVMVWAASQGYPGLIISGPAEQDRVLLRSAACFPPGRMSSICPSRKSPRSWHGVICSIGHDSGISHLGAAVGTTTLAFFGPTMPTVWGPRSRQACVVHPRPAGALTLDNLPPPVVINMLASLMHGTLQFVPSRVDCTILVVTNTAEILTLP